MCGCVNNKATPPGLPIKSLARVLPLEDQPLDPSVQIVDLNLHEDPVKRRAIPLYYRICRESSSTSLHVTTSCFAVWKRHKRTNGYAKIIPAVLEGSDKKDPVCVFFFDDNLQYDGTEGGQGICNLRDIAGEFVDFSEGCNGFVSDHLHGHTVVHHSSKYRNVLVKANILDALYHEDYFWGIIQRYARPGEKLLVFMDVNSTIMCSDTSAGKDTPANLLSIMYELMEVRPREGFDLQWDSYPPFRVERRMSLKQLVKELHRWDKEGSNSFWKEENCTKLLHMLEPLSTVAWLTGSTTPAPVSHARFGEDFRMYLEKVTDEFRSTGITRSWFQCFDTLQRSKHSVILNSFGTDTRKVVLATVPDERQVMQITVNYELWEDGDKTNFVAQYSRKATPPTSEQPGTFKAVPPSSRPPWSCLPGRSSSGAPQTSQGPWASPRPPSSPRALENDGAGVAAVTDQR